jgi:hypothetical protein
MLLNFFNDTNGFDRVNGVIWNGDDGDRRWRRGDSVGVGWK